MTETDVVASVILVKMVILALSLVLTHLTFRAYQRSRRQEIWVLSVGFGSISVGVLLGGAVYEFLHVDVMLGLLVEAVFTALGLGMVLYSLYGFR